MTKIKIVKKASNPESVKETERLFGEAVEIKGQPEPMNVNFHKSKFDERLLKLSVLRAGYLVGIAVADSSPLVRVAWDAQGRPVEPYEIDLLELPETRAA